MTNIAARPWEWLWMRTSLYNLFLKSLLFEYGSFQMSYNTIKDKWNVHESHNMLVQEETILKNQGSYSVHYVSHQGNQGAGKKFVKKYDKGKGPLKINEDPVQFQKKASKGNNCHFCGKSGYFQDCPKCKAWFENKGELMLMYVLNQT